MAEILVKLCRRMPEFKSDPNFVITPAIWRESEKILKRCYKMLEITEYERTAWVRKALAEAKPEVLAELTTPGSCKYTDPDAAIIVHDPEDDDNMGIDVEYLDCLRRGLSPEAYRLMRDYCLPATVVQRFCHLEPLRLFDD